MIRRFFTRQESPTAAGQAPGPAARRARRSRPALESLEGRTLLSAPASADPKERIAAALGSQVHPHLLEVEERRLGLTVHGFVASPEFTLPNARGLYTLVNRRYIRGLQFGA